MCVRVCVLYLIEHLKWLIVLNYRVQGQMTDRQSLPLRHGFLKVVDTKGVFETILSLSTQKLYLYILY